MSRKVQLKGINDGTVIIEKEGKRERGRLRERENAGVNVRKRGGVKCAHQQMYWILSRRKKTLENIVIERKY